MKDLQLDLATKLLDVAIKVNEIPHYLLGFPGYEIYGKDGYGGREHNYNLSVSAIYEKYKTDQNIAKKFEDALLFLFTKNKSQDYFMKGLNVLKYHMICEKEKKAPFKIDVDKLLKEARNSIIANKDIFAYNSSSDNYMEDFRNYDKDIRTNYGKSIF